MTSKKEVLQKKANLRLELRTAMSQERANAMIAGDSSALDRHIEALHRAVAREQEINYNLIEELL